MTDLPFLTPDPDPARPVMPKRCRRHDWVQVPVLNADAEALLSRFDPMTGAFVSTFDQLAKESPSFVFEVRCRFCPAKRDETAARRGKSARRLGSDQERRIERVYGPTKIGERGDPVDHIGRVWRWQSKASRSLPPKWLAAISAPTWRATLPAAITDAHERMAGLYGDRASVVIRSYVHAGTRTRDWLFIDGPDGFEELGLHGVSRMSGWWVIPGDAWLDMAGKDSEVAG